MKLGPSSKLWILRSPVDSSTGAWHSGHLHWNTRHWRGSEEPRPRAGWWHQDTMSVPSPSQHHTLNIQHPLLFTGLSILTWPLKLWCSCSYLTLLSHVFSLGAPISACANKNFLLCLQNWIKIGIFRTVVKCIKSIPAPLSSGHVLQMQTFELLKYFSIKLNTAASNNNFRHFTESIEKL